MTVPQEQAPANYVPAAAVIRRVRALPGFIGRKGRVGGLCTSHVKSLGSTGRGHVIRHGSSKLGGNGIPGVVVECVDIGRNTSGEGGCLELC